MKTFECVVRSCNTGKQIVLFIRSYNATDARMDALEQARVQFGSAANGGVSIESAKEV